MIYEPVSYTNLDVYKRQIFTIEPMVNMGKADIYVDDKNNWEVYTDDGLPSAQWEIMVPVSYTHLDVYKRQGWNGKADGVFGACFEVKNS